MISDFLKKAELQIKFRQQKTQLTEGERKRDVRPVFALFLHKLYFDEQLLIWIHKPIENQRVNILHLFVNKQLIR